MVIWGRRNLIRVMKISVDIIEKILVSSFQSSNTTLDPNTKEELLLKLQEYLNKFTDEIVLRSIENKPKSEIDNDEIVLNERDIERIIGLLLLDMWEKAKSKKKKRNTYLEWHAD